MKETLQTKYARILKENRSAVEIESRTGKYVVLKSQDSKGDLFWFLGKSGAVRVNRKNASTTSVDFATHFKKIFADKL